MTVFLICLILQILQGPCETVREYLSSLFQNATNRDIPEQVLLTVGINGLRPEIRRIVMNREPKNVEELRHCATLAEKSSFASESNLQLAVNNMQSDIQSIKDHLTSNTAIVDQVNCSYNNNTGHNYQHIPRATQYQDRPSSFPPQNYWPQNFHPRSRPNYRMSGGNQNNYRPQGQSSINQNTRYNQNRYSLPEKCSYCQNDRHPRNVCPARDKMCHNCKMIGHCSRACRHKIITRQ